MEVIPGLKEPWLWEEVGTPASAHHFRGMTLQDIALRLEGP